MLIHGGFWRARYDLRLEDRLVADLAARGWAAWNLEYRRLGWRSRGGWPATFEDVAAGIDLLGRLEESLDLPESGVWHEILNSDAQAYGGSGVGNLGTVHAGENGRATMVLPPLGVLWLRHDPQAHLPSQARSGRLLLP